VLCEIDRGKLIWTGGPTVQQRLTWKETICTKIYGSYKNELAKYLPLPNALQQKLNFYTHIFTLVACKSGVKTCPTHAKRQNGLIKPTGVGEFM